MARTRFADAACEMESVDCGRLVFKAGEAGERADEVQIAARIRDRGWLRGE